MRYSSLTNSDNLLMLSVILNFFFFCILGELFKSLVGKYIKKALHKGVPPLFVDLRPLYKDPEKVRT